MRRNGRARQTPAARRGPAAGIAAVRGPRTAPEFGVRFGASRVTEDVPSTTGPSRRLHDGRPRLLSLAGAG